MPHIERFSLKGRRALVTGSSQGIGLALARGLAEAGAQVILNGRDRAKLQAAAESFRKDGLPVESASFDVTNADSVQAGIGALLEGGKVIDILVNNAGIQRRAPMLEMPLSTWDEVLATNLTSAFLIGRAVAPGMIARKSGKIVNICSLMSDLARPTIAPYSAAKGGLRMLTRSMCSEWGKENIQINGLSPGYISTELTRPLMQNAQFDGWVKGRTPAARWGEVEDLIGACVFLCSPASNFVNGQLLTVDGGMSAVV